MAIDKQAMIDAQIEDISEVVDVDPHEVDALQDHFFRTAGEWDNYTRYYSVPQSHVWVTMAQAYENLTDDEVSPAQTNPVELGEEVSSGDF